MRWSSVIASAVASESIGVIMTMSSHLFLGTGAPEGPISIIALGILVFASIVMLLVSYALFKSKEWARRLVIALSYVWLLTFLIYLVIQAINTFNSIDDYLVSAGALIMLFTPVVVFILVLSHPDVRCEFIPKASNTEEERNA